jgi:flagellin-like protein
MSVPARNETVRLNERGQSEVIGTVLLVGVVVVTASLVGTGLLASTEADDDPLVDVDGEVAPDLISLTHAGGESLAVAELIVILRTDDGESRIPFADGSLDGATPEQFDPGETWTTTASFDEGESVEVYLVHKQSNAVVFRGRKVA